ncbi:hypothetical protein E3N88_06459 [Mikania micrantha]|uniref:Uncharacterized protein n=1 Tax=Mikania micrantha TaxID=192012 RepID=A0A5N6PNS8_9ASTR|nr:hypothetical protein E3N88_06459 [Mikania micrantha]
MHHHHNTTRELFLRLAPPILHHFQTNLQDPNHRLHRYLAQIPHRLTPSASFIVVRPVPVCPRALIDVAGDRRNSVSIEKGIKRSQNKAMAD